jgi:hypothetical protein
VVELVPVVELTPVVEPVELRGRFAPPWGPKIPLVAGLMTADDGFAAATPVGLSASSLMSSVVWRASTGTVDWCFEPG